MNQQGRTSQAIHLIAAARLNFMKIAPLYQALKRPERGNAKKSQRIPLILGRENIDKGC